jgi:hypothetical protein
MPALMQKEPVFLIKVGPKKGPGSFRVQNNIDFGPPRRGQIKYLKIAQKDADAGHLYQ